MGSREQIRRKFGLTRDTALGRWVSVGPYYAMFPVEFAFHVISSFSKPGDFVLDPFMGRATSVFAAAAQGRRAYGIEINPLGWVYGKAKLWPGSESAVRRRVSEIYEESLTIPDEQLHDMPEFFRICFSDNVLRYLIAARACLDWRSNELDATTMVIILIDLHGKRGSALSNQMRQTKAMAPDYSVRWWQERGLEPPDLDPVKFLHKKLDWRYKKGVPDFTTQVDIELADSTEQLLVLENKVRRGELPCVDLVFTSPPYCGVTNYYYDQWIRFWMLGGTDQPAATSEKWKGKFESKEQYRELLDTVFAGCARILSDTGKLYIRTDAREFTCNTTVDILKTHFPDHRLVMNQQPYQTETQTALFGDKTTKPGEVDIQVLPRQ